MLKRLFRILLLFVALLFIVLFVIASKQVGGFKRDPHVLMNTYYRLKLSHPLAAEQALKLILKQDPQNMPALIELSQWLIEKNQIKQALPFLEKIHHRFPENEAYRYQLGYAYYVLGEWAKSNALFRRVSHHSLGPWHEKAQQALRAMDSFIPLYQDFAEYTPLLPPSPAVSMMRIVKPSPFAKGVSPEAPMALFYRLKADPHANMKAWRCIQSMIKRHPMDVAALTEGGFLAMKLGYQTLAIDYFTRAYAITKNASLAMQLGYLYNQEKMNHMAYRAFEWASKSSDNAEALRAEKALTQLAGQQTKALPTPYYGELYVMPFSQSRFHLTVSQLIGRLGVEQQNRWQSKEYVYIRRTQDNRSKNIGQLSEIYEDNVEITGVGGQFAPFSGLPILAFAEMGIAYDLIDQQRDLWRSDFRSGLMYYQVFGAQPSYVEKLTLQPDYYGLWYGDITYFSRYNNNIIAVGRTHQGIRAIQYKSSLVNVYLRGVVVQDTKRLFYNNFAEIGPGVSIVPSDRYNLELRVEYINGAYLPAGAIVNPYGKYYTNTLVQLLAYVKI